MGNSDIKKLNQVLEKLNDKAEISKTEVIEVIASKSKDRDANYRNFVSRIKNALVYAIENSTEDRERAILKSITIDNLKANITEEARLSFSAKMPREIPDTVRENPNYNSVIPQEKQTSFFPTAQGFKDFIFQLFKEVNLLYPEELSNFCCSLILD